MGYVELFLIMVLVFVVVGPKEFPKVMFAFGDFWRRLKMMGHTLYDQLENFSEYEDKKK